MSFSSYLAGGGISRSTHVAVSVAARMNSHMSLMNRRGVHTAVRLHVPQPPKIRSIPPPPSGSGGGSVGSHPPLPSPPPPYSNHPPPPPHSYPHQQQQGGFDPRGPVYTPPPQSNPGPYYQPPQYPPYTPPPFPNSSPLPPFPNQTNYPPPPPPPPTSQFPSFGRSDVPPPPLPPGSGGTPNSEKSWFRRHWILSIFLGLMGSSMIILSTLPNVIQSIVRRLQERMESLLEWQIHIRKSPLYKVGLEEMENELMQKLGPHPDYTVTDLLAPFSELEKLLLSSLTHGKFSIDVRFLEKLQASLLSDMKKTPEMMNAINSVKLDSTPNIDDIPHPLRLLPPNSDFNVSSSDIARYFPFISVAFVGVQNAFVIHALSLAIQETIVKNGDADKIEALLQMKRKRLALQRFLFQAGYGIFFNRESEWPLTLYAGYIVQLVEVNQNIADYTQATFWLDAFRKFYPEENRKITAFELQRAEVAQKQRQYSEAIDHWKRAIEMMHEVSMQNPQDKDASKPLEEIRALVQLSHCYSSSNQLNQAWKSADEASAAHLKYLADLRTSLDAKQFGKNAKDGQVAALKQKADQVSNDNEKVLFTASTNLMPASKLVGLQRAATALNLERLYDELRRVDPDEKHRDKSARSNDSNSL